MEDSTKASPSGPSVSSAFGAFLPVPVRQVRKRKVSSKSPRSYESDDSFSQPKLGKYVGDHVSNWTTFQLESVGIFYDVQATDLSELYKSPMENMYEAALKKPTLINKLKKMKQLLIESTKKCLHSLDVDETFVMDTLDWKDVKKENKKCLEAITKTREEMSMKIGSLDNISRDFYSLWFAGISEYVQYYSDLIKNLNSVIPRRAAVEGEFSQLLANFSKIFLMNPMRGDAMQKVQVKINGIETTSVPYLRYSLCGDFSEDSERNASLVTVAIGEVKSRLLADDEKMLPGFRIGNLKFKNHSAEKLLGQHGGELILESTKSLLKSTNFGIICFRSMIIFTRLEWNKSHLPNLLLGSDMEDERSSILYSKPYNFLVRKEREEVLDTMFDLGLLCRSKSLLSYPEIF